MILQKGDMWSAFSGADLFLATANSTVTRAGYLVMGKGIAKEVKDRYPDLAYNLGQAIILKGRWPQQRYGLLVNLTWDEVPPDYHKIGLFQVKYDYRTQADLDLIEYSTEALCDFCEHFPEAEIHLNFPGIGAGGLKPKQVLPIITWLPDQVHVWRKQ